jgi:hypothetical protein
MRKKRPKPEIDIGRCLWLRDRLDAARCGVAAANFSLSPEASGEEVSKVAIKLAKAGLNTAMQPFDSIKNDFAVLNEKFATLARKAKSSSARAAKLLRSGAEPVSKEGLDKARKAVGQALEIVGQLRVASNELCRKGRE